MCHSWADSCPCVQADQAEWCIKCLYAGVCSVSRMWITFEKLKCGLLHAVPVHSRIAPQCKHGAAKAEGASGHSALGACGNIFVCNCVQFLAKYSFTVSKELCANTTAWSVRPKTACSLLADPPAIHQRSQMLTKLSTTWLFSHNPIQLCPKYCPTTRTQRFFPAGDWSRVPSRLSSTKLYWLMQHHQSSLDAAPASAPTLAGAARRSAQLGYMCLSTRYKGLVWSTRLTSMIISDTAACKP